MKRPDNPERLEKELDGDYNLRDNPVIRDALRKAYSPPVSNAHPPVAAAVEGPQGVGRPPGVFSENQSAKIRTMYESGHSKGDIAKELGTSRKRIAAEIKDKGIIRGKTAAKIPSTLSRIVFIDLAAVHVGKNGALLIAFRSTERIQLAPEEPEGSKLQAEPKTAEDSTDSVEPKADEKPGAPTRSYLNQGSEEGLETLVFASPLSMDRCRIVQFANWLETSAWLGDDTVQVVTDILLEPDVQILADTGLREQLQGLGKERITYRDDLRRQLPFWMLQREIIELGEGCFPTLGLMLDRMNAGGSLATTRGEMAGAITERAKLIDLLEKHGAVLKVVGHAIARMRRQKPLLEIEEITHILHPQSEIQNTLFSEEPPAEDAIKFEADKIPVTLAKSLADKGLRAQIKSAIIAQRKFMCNVPLPIHSCLELLCSHSQWRGKWEPMRDTLKALHKNKRPQNSAKFELACAFALLHISSDACNIEDPSSPHVTPQLRASVHAFEQELGEFFDANLSEVIAIQKTKWQNSSIHDVEDAVSWAKGRLYQECSRVVRIACDQTGSRLHSRLCDAQIRGLINKRFDQALIDAEPKLTQLTEGLWAPVWICKKLLKGAWLNRSQWHMESLWKQREALLPPSDNEKDSIVPETADSSDDALDLDDLVCLIDAWNPHQDKPHSDRKFFLDLSTCKPDQIRSAVHKISGFSEVAADLLIQVSELSKKEGGIDIKKRWKALRAKLCEVWHWQPEFDNTYPGAE